MTLCDGGAKSNLDALQQWVDRKLSDDISNVDKEDFEMQLAQVLNEIESAW